MYLLKKDALLSRELRRAHTPRPGWFPATVAPRVGNGDIRGSCRGSGNRRRVVVRDRSPNHQSGKPDPSRKTARQRRSLSPRSRASTGLTRRGRRSGDEPSREEVGLHRPLEGGRKAPHLNQAAGRGLVDRGAALPPGDGARGDADHPGEDVLGDAQLPADLGHVRGTRTRRRAGPGCLPGGLRPGGARRPSPRPPFPLRWLPLRAHGPSPHHPASSRMETHATVHVRRPPIARPNSGPQSRGPRR